MSGNQEGKRRRPSSGNDSPGTPKKLRTAKKLGATPGKDGVRDIRPYFLSPTNSTGQEQNENELELCDRQSTRRDDACVRRLDQDFSTADDGSECSGDQSDLSSEIGETPLFKNTVEPCSVHRILVDRIHLPPNKAVDQDVQFDAERKKIEEIIERYNESMKKNPDGHNDDQLYSLDGEKEFKLPSELLPLMAEQQLFRTCVYIRQSESQTNLIRLCTSKPAEHKICNIHLIIFFYRQNEIYALTANQAWHVVHEFADFDFPMKIAARLCSEEGPIQTEEKNLIGPVVHGKKTTKSGHSSSVYDPPILCLNYTGKLRQDASIKKIPSLSDKINIIFGFAYVRIKKPLEMSHFHLILDHFSQIINGDSTYKYLPDTEDGNSTVRPTQTVNSSETPGNLEDSIEASTSNDVTIHRQPTQILSSIDPQSNLIDPLTQSSQETQDDTPPTPISKLLEEDTTAYDRNLTKVYPALTKVLDLNLCQHIVDALNKKYSPALGFDLKHKHLEEFSLSARVDLIYKSIVIPLPTHPTLKDVVNAISENKDKEPIWKLLTQNLTAEHLHGLMSKAKLKIRFEDAKGKKRSENLRDFLEGEMIYKGCVFWRVMKMWCNLNPSYPLTLHKWFISFLSKCLIENRPADQHYMRLKKKWPRLQSLEPDADVVKHYASQYKDEKGFFLPLEKDSGLFDLMYVEQLEEKLSIVLYFIVPNFATDTSSVCARIDRCKEAFKTAMKSRRNFQGPFRDFYHHCVKEKSPLISDYSFDAFRGFLSESNIVFALRRAQPQWEMTTGPLDRMTQRTKRFSQFKPTMIRESQLSLSIRKVDIQRLLKKDDCPLTRDDMVKLSEKNTSSQLELYAHLAGVIHKEIKNSHYISREDDITVKFLYCNERNFQYNSPHINENGLRKKLYRLLVPFQTGYRSLRAKLEIRETDRYVRNTLKNKFFVDEIEEGSEEEQNGDNEENQDDESGGEREEEDEGRQNEDVQNGGEREEGEESSQIEDEIMEQEAQGLDIEASD